MYTKKKLKNGVTMITVPVESTEAFTVLALFPVGSRYETPKQGGMSHFIEHMMFKGTIRRPNTIDISKALDRVGAEYNAYTSRDYTGYYIKIDSSKMELAIDLLSDMLWESKLDEKELEREKGVIVEEINMYRDNPTMYVEQLFEELLYQNHPLGRDIAGTEEIVRSITQKEMAKYYKEFYQPKNLVLVLAGKIDKKINAAKYFSKINEKVTPRKYLSAKNKHKHSTNIKIRFKETDQVHVALGFPAYSHDDERTFATTILNIILGGTMSSRLFTEVRERRGLAYMIRSGLNHYQDVGNLVIQAGLDKKRLAEALEVIMAEIEKIKKVGVTEDELSMAKENIAGRVVLSLEESSAQAEWYGKQALLMKKIMTPAERLKRYNAVSLADIKKVANNIFNLKDLKLAIIGPYKNEAVIRKMLKF